MYVQIFAEFDKQIKKHINLNMEGYIIPVLVSYGFTSDRTPGDNTIWYNLKGNPGIESSTNFYKRFKSGGNTDEDQSEIIFEGFKMEIDLEAGFKKAIYKVSYCYKYKNSHTYDRKNCMDKEEIYIYETPNSNFWEAVMY